VEVAMPRYYFDIKDGHRFVDPDGKSFKNNHDAIERAKAVAIVVSIDQPEVDPTRYISVLNEARAEIFQVPVYSKPAAA
jgi:CTP:molybdopterin cytidylyltransferase MocA